MAITKIGNSLLTSIKDDVTNPLYLGALGASLASGKSSVGEGIGDVVGGALGYRVGGNIMNKLLPASKKGILAGATRFLGKATVAGIGSSFASNWGHKLAPIWQRGGIKKHEPKGIW